MATGALMLAASALASPYLFNYDLPFLIFPILWLCDRGLAEGFRRFEKPALVVAVVRALHDPRRVASAGHQPDAVRLDHADGAGVVARCDTLRHRSYDSSVRNEAVSMEQVGNLASDRALSAPRCNAIQGMTMCRASATAVPVPISWTQPRAHRDASLRYMTHGPYGRWRSPACCSACSAGAEGVLLSSASQKHRQTVK